MPEFSNNGNVVLIGQVTKAKSNHRVEKSTRLLRNDRFPGDTNVVYLGNIASAIIASLESPDTPEFLEMPGYNEQKWRLKTVSGPLTVKITSDSSCEGYTRGGDFCGTESDYKIYFAAEFDRPSIYNGTWKEKKLSTKKSDSKISI